MAMIGGERAELAACADSRVSPALQRRMDDVFATLFAGRRPLPADTEDADDRMRIAPPRPERIAIAAAEAAPRWADAEPGEVPAIVAG
ncbi:MAG TPA: hypothetical protein VGB24_07710 [Longimicrobium sp.]|jgi:hypothetical protein|uniref:hypothetical protein n=1 Tax=Longimicrobium sp. TaxID=2029185 RepID=UPI002EDA4EE8